MNVKIDVIQLGIDNCYLIRGDGAIVVDGGVPKKGSHFIKALEMLKVKQQDVQMIVLTHGHWDHIGSAKDIKDITGAQIAMHYKEKEWLEKSLKPLPPGVTLWGRIFIWIMSIFMPLVDVAPSSVDIVLGDSELSLNKYGIPGKIIYTPGHSSGSVSVLLETGEAFVGDLAMNGFPLRIGPGLPVLAEDMQKVKESWRLLLNSGARTVYPAHGKPFSADVVRRILGI